MRGSLVKGAVLRASLFEVFGKGQQLWCETLPIIECRLQRRRDVVCRGAACQVAGDDDKLSVARAVIQGRQLHGRILSPGFDGSGGAGTVNRRLPVCRRNVFSGRTSNQCSPPEDSWTPPRNG